MGKYREQWSALHGNARPSRLVSSWLATAEVLAKPLIWLRLSPNVISLIGLVMAGVAYIATPSRIAAVIVLLSLVLDGLDGAVAVLTNRVTTWGGIIDSFVDRMGEALWAGALVVAGVDARIALTAWCLALIQEYARARGLTLAPHAEVKATLCERPVRALLIASALAVGSLAGGASAWALLWLVFQAIGFVQVWRATGDLLR